MSPPFEEDSARDRVELPSPGHPAREERGNEDRRDFAWRLARTKRPTACAEKEVEALVAYATPNAQARNVHTSETMRTATATTCRSIAGTHRFRCISVIGEDNGWPVPGDRAQLASVGASFLDLRQSPNHRRQGLGDALLPGADQPLGERRSSIPWDPKRFATPVSWRSARGSPRRAGVDIIFPAVRHDIRPE